MLYLDLPFSAGAVTDLDLGDRNAHGAGDGGNEPVELAVEVDALDDLPAEGLERTAVVVELDPREAGDEPVRHDGREPARQEPVLPVLPPARNDVVSGVDLGEQGGDVRRIVLEVGVQGDDDVPPGEIEPRGQGGRLAEVPPEPDDADPRVARPEALQGLERAVRASVIDEDDLVGPPESGADPAELLIELGEALLLVEDGDDQRNLYPSCYVHLRKYNTKGGSTLARPSDIETSDLGRGYGAGASSSRARARTRPAKISLAKPRPEIHAASARRARNSGLLKSLTVALTNSTGLEKR